MTSLPLWLALRSSLLPDFIIRTERRHGVRKHDAHEHDTIPRHAVIAIHVFPLLDSMIVRLGDNGMRQGELVFLPLACDVIMPRRCLAYGETGTARWDRRKGCTLSSAKPADGWQAITTSYARQAARHASPSCCLQRARRHGNDGAEMAFCLDGTSVRHADDGRKAWRHRQQDGQHMLGLLA